MKYIVTLKGFTPASTFEKIIQKGIKKLEQRFIHFKNDLPTLTIVIKRHEKHKFFSGQFMLELPKETLLARCHGHHEEAILSCCFNKILNEFEKYKGKHFKSHTTYPHHQSLRKDYFL